jgi:hypothetical protein
VDVMAQKNIQRFREKFSRSGRCWEWCAAKNRDGYGLFVLGKLMPAHRAAWLLFRGEIPAAMYVCHSCDNRACVNPAHLWLGTQTDNMRDKVGKGRCGHTAPKKPVSGSRHHNSKLTEDAVREIRALARTGVTQAAIATLFGVTDGAVSHVLTGRTWSHVA